MSPRQIALALVSVGCFLVGGIAQADTPARASGSRRAPASRPAPTPPPPPPAPAPAAADTPDETASADAMEVIASDAGLSGDALKKFNDTVADGKAKVDAWNASEDGKKLADLRKQLATARRAKDKDTTLIAKLQDEIKPLNAQLTAVREKGRHDAMMLLSADQQSAVVKAALFRRLSKAMEEAQLSADQLTKLRAMGDAAVPDYLKTHPLDKDPYIRSIIGLQSRVSKQAKAEILTEEQRAKLSKPKTPTTKPTA